MDSTSQFLDLKTFATCKGFKIVHLNVRSLLSKFDVIHNDFLCNDIDILTLSETWLRPSIPDGLVHAKDYILCRFDRVGNEQGQKISGGGVCTYIRKELQYDVSLFEHLNWSDQHVEFQIIVIGGNNCKRILLVNAYRPPAGNPDVACEIIKSQLTQVADLHKYEIVLVGDLNLDCSAPSNESYKKVNNLCSEFGLKNYIDKPTRSTLNTSSVLDIILTNIKNVNSYGVLNYNISDHNPVFIIKRRIHNNKNKIWVEGRSYKNYDRDLFMHKIANLDWSILALLNDPNEAWHMIYKAIVYEADIMCPIRKFKVNTLKPDWYTLDLLQQARERDRLARLAKRHKTQESWGKFTTARNKFNSDIKAAKNDYTLDMLERNSQNQTKFWKSIKSILPVRNVATVDKVIDPITNNVCEGVEAANVINNFFNTIGPKLSESLPVIQKPNSDLNVACKFDQLPPITEPAVIKLIESINTSKSSCLDKLPSKLLKDALLAIPSQITHLFNMSLITGIFPDAWKEGKISPILKKGNITEVNNLRPITQTPLIGKLLERYVTDHITNYLESNNLLYTGQGGFRKNHSTIKSAFSLISDVCHNKNNKEYTLAVFLDISKAFDSVNHDVLLHKISKIGIGGSVLEWLNNYLYNRTQYVVSAGHCSSKKHTICGVPQGSVIGPILFLIYVNDMLNLNVKSKITLFADDTVMYLNGKDLDVLKCQLQLDLNALSKWCCYNKLCINVCKTKAMLFGDGFGASNSVCPDLLLCNNVIEKVNKYEYLGVIVDENLTFNEHALKVTNNVISKLHLLSLLRKQITCKCAVAVYKTMILPLFDYGNVFLTSCNEAVITKLQRLQNRGLRVVLKRNCYASVNLLHVDAKILPLKYRQKLSVIKLMFNMKSNLEMRDVRPFSTRLHDHVSYKISFPNTERFKRSIAYVGPTFWNELPPYLKSIEDRDSFYINLKWYFWRQFIDESM